jgi:selenocysteine lyase/cysteine desulfurase
MATPDRADPSPPSSISAGRFRSLFPALERWVWLDTATISPGARPVLDAVARALAEWEEGTHSWRRWEDEGEVARGLFARLVGAPAGSIALMPSLAAAAATVAACVPPGRIVVGAEEFRSNLFPWQALRARGHDVVEVPAEHGVVTTAALVAAIAPGTSLVALTEVASSTGFRADVTAVTRRCREVGARTFLNLTQSLGVLRFDAGAVGTDYAAAHGYKWMLAPRGAAWLYVAPRHIATMTPLAPSWKSVPEPHAGYYGGTAHLPAEARRLDLSLDWLSWVGARAALELLLSLDAAEVEARCLELAGHLRAGVRGRGIGLVPEELPSQVVGVRVDDPEAVRRRLRGSGVVATVRSGLLRLGFHAFNDPADVEAALRALDGARSHTS